jgi:YggT family protein
MLNEALLFLLDVLLQPFAAILLLRFHLQWLRAPLRNPIGEFVMVLTDFVVLRVRRFIPSARGLDMATFLLALLVEMLYLTALLWVLNNPTHKFCCRVFSFWPWSNCSR